MHWGVVVVVRNLINDPANTDADGRHTFETPNEEEPSLFMWPLTRQSTFGYLSFTSGLVHSEHTQSVPFQLGICPVGASEL